MPTDRPPPKPTPPPKKSPGPKPGGLQPKNARFVASVDRVGQVPSGPPEVAIVGRSNVGKSSLINALCNHQGLARTSRTPGRTQRINLFDLDLSTGQTVRLVDLPGFGHAEAPREVREQFSEMIQFYLLGQEHMRAVILLLDSRRDTDPDAVGFSRWLRENGVPVEVVATKADQLPKNQLGNAILRLQKDFGLKHTPLAVSTLDGRGVDELRVRLRNLAYPKKA